MKYVFTIRILFLVARKLNRIRFFFNCNSSRPFAWPWCIVMLLYWSNTSIPFSLSIVNFFYCKSSKLFKQSAGIISFAFHLPFYPWLNKTQTEIAWFSNGYPHGYNQRIFIQYVYLPHNERRHFFEAIVTSISPFLLILSKPSKCRHERRLLQIQTTSPLPL